MRTTDRSGSGLESAANGGDCVSTAAHHRTCRSTCISVSSAAFCQHCSQPSHGIFLSFAETFVCQTITASIKFHGILYASVMPHHEHALDLLRPVEIRNAIERRLEVIFYCDDKWLLRNATLFSDVIERRQIKVNNGCSQRRSEGGAGRTGRHLLGAANGRKLFLKIHVKIQIVISYVLRAIKTKHYSCSAYLSSVSWAMTLGLWLRPLRLCW